MDIKEIKLNTFEEIASYVDENEFLTLCVNAFQGYFLSLGLQLEPNLELLCEAFDNRLYKEIEITSADVKAYIADIKEQLESYRYVYDELLHDENSKKTLKELLAARLTLRFCDLAQVCTPHPSEYFDRTFFDFSASGVYVDCGGYNGDTALEYALVCPEYKKIIVFEADPTCIDKAKVRLNGLAKDDSVVFIEAAVGDQNGTVCFAQNNCAGDGAVTAERADIVVRQQTIDELEQDVTFIKMDIEGSEYKALKGAEKTIQRCHPDLAICVYHKPHDLWQLITYIDNMGCGYEYALHHFGGTHFFDTVLYARSKKTSAFESYSLSASKKTERLDALMHLSTIFNYDSQFQGIQMEAYRAQLAQVASHYAHALQECEKQLHAYQSQAGEALRFDELSHVNEVFNHDREFYRIQIKSYREQLAQISLHYVQALQEQERRLHDCEMQLKEAREALDLCQEKMEQSQKAKQEAIKAAENIELGALEKYGRCLDTVNKCQEFWIEAQQMQAMLRQQNVQLSMKAEEDQRIRTALEQQNVQLKMQVETLSTQYNELLCSNSIRVTAPLRFMRNIFRRQKKHKGE